LDLGIYLVLGSWNFTFSILRSRVIYSAATGSVVAVGVAAGVDTDPEGVAGNRVVVAVGILQVAVVPAISS
jgi:hypothetical protein